MSEYLEQVVNCGDKASRLARAVCFGSHNNNRAVRIIRHQPGNFRGPVSFVWRKSLLGQMAAYDTDIRGNVTSWTLAESVENDGAGGKPQFFSFVGTEEVFYNLGWEIVAMVADDFARTGRFPAVMSNELNIQRITDDNFHLFAAMMAGYQHSLAKAGLVNITGETAVMRNSVTAFCDVHSDRQLILTWGASCIGLTHRSGLIDGSGICPGQVVVGLFEDGYRCNGGGFFTDLVLSTWGPDIHDVFQSQDARDFIQELTIPSQSYARFITRLVGWDDEGNWFDPDLKIAGIAHITGGGVWGKLGEILPAGVGADLHSMPTPPLVLVQGYELSQATAHPLSDYAAYGVLHGGCGMLLVCDPEYANSVVLEAVAAGIRASVVGETISSPSREIIIASQFSSAMLSSNNPK